jgi:hypothetical protein
MCRWKGARNVTDADNARAQVPPVNAVDLGWFRAYQNWRRGRLERVQASARVWLGVLTTLLGLLGSVVLFKGGDLITGVTRNGWFQAVLIIVVGLVFASAVLALIAGGSATWGGLAGTGDDRGRGGRGGGSAGRQVCG